MHKEQCQQLGKGAHGTVYRNNLHTVTKVYEKDEVFRKEVDILKSVSEHMYFPKLLQVIELSMSVVLPYRGPDLFSVLVENNLQISTWVICNQLFPAIALLHSLGIAHLDIKLENILWMNGFLCLCDFGCSSRIENPDRIATHLSECRGTLAYASPEMLRGDRFNQFQSDAWSLGIVLFACEHRVLPFKYAHRKDARFANFERRVMEETENPMSALSHVHALAQMCTFTWAGAQISALLHPIPTRRATLLSLIKTLS